MLWTTPTAVSPPGRVALVSLELPETQQPHRLAPAGSMLWRSTSSMQLEVGSHRLIVDGMTEAAARELLSETAPVDGDPDVQRLRAQLGDRGYLWPPAEGFVPPVPRLAAELTALSARCGQDASDRLAARGRRTVVVQGHGRVGSLVAAVLGAAGVGRVHVGDSAATQLVHAIPGGARPSDESTSLSAAAAAAILAAAPEVDVTPPAFGHSADLVVLAVDGPVDSDVRDALHAREASHLQVAVTSAAGVVGPLVVPRVTSCLACSDLHRRDRDPAWPALAVQLTLSRRHPRSGEIAACVATAGIAAGQALAFLDGELPEVLEGTLELHPPDWRVRRRTWPAHPDCGCMLR